MIDLRDGRQLSIIGLISIILLVVFAVGAVLTFTLLRKKSPLSITMRIFTILGFFVALALGLYSAFAFHSRSGEYSNPILDSIIIICAYFVLVGIAGGIIYYMIKNIHKSTKTLAVRSLVCIGILLSLSIVLYMALGFNDYVTYTITHEMWTGTVHRCVEAGTESLRWVMVPVEIDGVMHMVSQQVLHTCTQDGSLVVYSLKRVVEVVTTDTLIDAERSILIGFMLAPTLAAIAFAFIIIPKSLNIKPLEFTTREITLAGVFLALSAALSYVGIRMPAGGRITLAASTAIMIYAYFFGFRKGFIIITAFLTFQFIQGAWIINPWQALLDYVIPYMALVFFAIFNKSLNDKVLKLKFPVMFLIAAAGYVFVRYSSHVASGIIFGEEFLAAGGRPSRWMDVPIVPWSFFYNTFFLIDAVIAVAFGIVLLINKPLMKLLENAAMSQDGHDRSEGQIQENQA